jgi:multiple sugar transport system permease protein
MRRALDKAAFLAVACALVLFSLFPAGWFFLTSLKPAGLVTAIPPRLLAPFGLHFYRSALASYNLLHYAANSAVVAGCATAVSIAVATLAGYALARLRLPGRSLILYGVLAVGMFPQMAIAGPVWRLLGGLGLLNTYPGLILPYVALTLPLAIWIMATFFRELPRELEDAARVDGATRLQALWRVVLPLAAPGVFTAAILVFIYAWNEFFFALLIMTRPERQTLPVGIALFAGEYTIPWGELAAASVMATVPLILLVLLFQRRIVSGLTAGAVKG